MMNTLRWIYHMMLADLRERVRTPKFLVIIGLAMLAGYAYIPATDSATLSIALGPWRGVNNSAWVGTVFGMLTVLIMPILGYFLVKNAIELDRRTNVGRVIATTPISKPVYVLGKWLSNLATLTMILFILNIMALVMQLVRAEVTQVDLWALSAPIWLMGFPIFALIAAIAVLFESISFLSGTFGNILFFIGWVLFLEFIGLPGLFEFNVGVIQPHNDLLGVSLPLASLQAIGNQLFPEFVGHFNFGGANYGMAPQIVDWQGVDWTLAYMLDRLSWLALAIGLTLSAALPFDRFDPALASASKADSPLKRFFRRKQSVVEPAFLHTKVDLTPLAEQVSSSRFGRLLIAELKLMFKGKRWWWYGVAAFISLLGFAGPPDGRAVTAQLAVLWPVIAWSAMGTREEQFDTTKLLFSAVDPIKSQLLATWLSGVLLGLIATLGVSLRMVIEGQAGFILAFWVAALFIPSLALGLGSVSGSPRLFEAVYLIWWFLGVNGVKPMDFMQGSWDAVSLLWVSIYLLLAMIFFSLALAGRWRRLVK
ncbi:MAG: ABC-2 transporter permease [Anaerolineales bacterium]|nr:ABC-2 transporter permease [Anaerolineales bacterium]